jgi:hypothetical protein
MRILVEGKDQAFIQSAADDIAKAVNTQIGA